MFMICTKPNSRERVTGAMHFSFFVGPGEPSGPLKLWPTDGFSAEEDLRLWIEETKAALAEGRLWPYRQKVIHANGTVERSWLWCDALGREDHVEPIDLAPIPWQQAHEWHWPQTPKSFVPQRQAA